MLLAGLLCSLAAAPQSVPGNAAGEPSAASQTQEVPMPESALPGAPAGLLGRSVEQVRIAVEGGQPIEGALQDELLKKIPLKAGERLERDKVRDSIRLVYRSGRFATVEADASLLPSGGVAVEFRSRPNYFNGNVTATGLPKGGPNESQVVNTGRLELGTEFSEEKLKDSEDRILRLMHDSGYWTAKVDAKLSPHPDTQQMDVLLVVTAGVAARVGKLGVSGDPGLPEAEAAEICKMQPGIRVRGDLLVRAVARLRKRYVKQRRLRAQLSAGVPVFHPESNTVDYTIVLDPGPVVDIRVEGVHLSRGKLKRYVPVWEEHAVDEDLLNEGRRNLRDYLQSQGYFDAVVQVRQSVDTAHQLLHIVFSIQPGERRTLRAIELQGNHRFNTATLRERMATQVSGALQRHGRYSQSQVSDDLQAIKNLYQSNGYPQVKATSQVIDDYQGKRGEMKLVVSVDEGPLVKVARLEIRGARAVSEAELRGLINTQAGQPFSEAAIADDREVVLNEYFNRGFASVQLESSAKYSDATHLSMGVVYDIREGPQEFVRRVLVSGVEHTKPHIVQRAIVIRAEAPLSQEKMLQTQRKLYDLGIFNEVDTAIQNPEGDERRKNVLFQIKEARRWTFGYGGGIEIGSGLNTSQGGSPQGQAGVSPRVILEVTRINFRGRDESLIFKSHFGTLEKRASLSFDEPRWFDLPNWRMTLTGLYDNTRDVNTFSSSREEGSLQLAQRATKATEFLYRFSYRRILVDPSSFPSGFTPALIPLYSQPVRVGMPSLTFLRDKRDDPVNSTKGNYTTFDIGVASSYFGSQADFGRVLAQNATYHKFFRGWVFARSLRIGVETPYGTLGFIPLPERYFVGGSNSHRGFAINQAGPRDPDSGAPLGGNAMIVNNLELRFPPAHLPLVGDNLSFVIFHDMGNAFGTSNQMWKNLLRFNQRDQASCRSLDPAATCDFSYMSQALGTGVRYRTPIGPVRVDVGYNLNPPVFPIKDPCAGVVGTCTAGAPSVEQVRHFNFYFSIGQTF
jgi:outer membrane protein insertion porin family